MTAGGAAVAGRFLAALRPPAETAPPLELDEAEVVWSPTSFSDEQTLSPPSPAVTAPFRSDCPGISSALSDDRRPFLRRKPAALSAPAPAAGARLAQSAPVNVPVWPKAASRPAILWFWDEDDDGDDDDVVAGDVAMLPPHEMVARAHKETTFSVFEGAGRTLKGRDLSRVRNAVLQKTGFLD